MKTVAKNILLDEAINIGNELLNLKKIDEKGISWDNLILGDDLAITSTKTYSLYSGSSGVALFFLELYLQTQKPEYLKMAKGGIEWAKDYCLNNPVSFAFYTGGLGVIHSMLRMYEVTSSKHYLRDALRLCKQISGLHKEPISVDLLNGLSGSLLVLLPLYSYSKKKWLLKLINDIVGIIIEKMEIGDKGIFWEKSNDTIRGLCGYSHGAAGIGHTFLELGRYFKNNTFYYISELAFAYENRHFNKKSKNWPDYRKLRQSNEEFHKHRTAYLNNNKRFFSTTGDMNGWCHGAAGIGFARIRGYELLKKQKYKRDIISAVNKTITTDIKKGYNRKMFIYCHGICGDAELFIESYNFFNDKYYYQLADKIAKRVLAFKKTGKIYRSGLAYADAEGKYDASLFMGYSGIGYFFLRLYNPKIKSLLYPKIDCKPHDPNQLHKYKYLDYSLTDLHKKIIEKVFPKTAAVISIYQDKLLNGYYQSVSKISPDKFNISKLFINYIKKECLRMPLKQREIIFDIMKLESIKFKMEYSIKSYAYLDIQNIVLEEFTAEMLANSIDEMIRFNYSIVPGIKIVKTKRDYYNEGWNEDIKTGKNIRSSYICLKQTITSIREYPLSPFAHYIINSIKFGHTTKGIIKSLHDIIKPITPKDSEMIKNNTIKQIRELITFQIIKKC